MVFLHGRRHHVEYTCLGVLGVLRLTVIGIRLLNAQGYLLGLSAAPVQVLVLLGDLNKLVLDGTIV